MNDIVIITSCDMNNGIAAGGDKPWRIPEDDKRFKSLTKDAVVIVGRKTWETLSKKSMSSGTVLVMTHDGRVLEDGTQTYTFTKVRELLRFKKVTGENPDAPIFVAGGAEIYTLFLPYASTLFMTRVMDHYEQMNQFFPKIEDMSWAVASISAQRLSQREIPYRYITFHRKSDPLSL